MNPSETGSCERLLSRYGHATQRDCGTVTFFWETLLFFIFLPYKTSLSQPPLIPPLSPSTTSSSPRSTVPPISFQKRGELSGTSTEYGMTKCSKTGHYPSYQTWMRQSSKRKKVPQEGETIRQTPTPTLMSPTKTPTLKNTVCVQRALSRPTKTEQLLLQSL